MSKHTITDDQIQQLRNEAATFGDDEQARICDAAMRGNDEARAQCAEAINAARAMDGDDDGDGDDY